MCDGRSGLRSASLVIRLFLIITLSALVLTRIEARQQLADSHGLALKGDRTGGDVNVFYHVTAINTYRDIVLDHLSKLHLSGLYKRVDNVFCFILGKQEAMDEAAQLLLAFGSKIRIADTSTDLEQYERFTLLRMRAYVRPGDKVLYMHSKGVKSEAIRINIAWWSLYMQYFLMRDGAQRCLELLDTYDAVGVDWKEPQPGETFTHHFSGNWWWTKGSYYLSLNGSIGASYLDPEFYIGTGSPRVFSLWQSQNNMYHRNYLPRYYVDADASTDHGVD